MKSIFSKYIVTFGIVLFMCILTVTLVVTSLVYDYVRDSKLNDTHTAAENTSQVIEVFLNNNKNIDGLSDAFCSDYELGTLVGFLAMSSQVEIYVADAEGDLIYTSVADHSVFTLPETVISSMSKNDSGEISGFSLSSLDGFLSGIKLNSFSGDTVAGEKFYVIASTDKIGTEVFSARLVSSTITVALWMFLAAMISLYIVTKKSTNQLAEISKAAKNYAQGNFGHKVVVEGQDEIAELALAINDMSQSLARMDEDRNSFIGNVSHDLRTPMTTISGFIDGILDGTIPPEKHSYYLGIVSQEVRRLSRLVSTLLELSRMESGKTLKKQNFNLSEKARTVLLSLESKINFKNLSILFDTGDDDVFVHADPDSIHQVIYNLMDNAIKFTPVSGEVAISVGVIRVGKKEQKALFSIRNTGEGIPSEELPHVFERFYKTDRSRGLDKSGTGLGLYIARTSIRNHGDDITVDSVVNEYTEFRFTLPYIEKTPGR